MWQQQHHRRFVSATTPKWTKLVDEDVDDLSIYFDKWRYEDETDEYLDDGKDEYLGGVTQYQYDQMQLAMEEGRRPPGTEWMPDQHEFPDTYRIGAELDVRIVKVKDDMALCRPVDHPHIKGMIPVHEMDEDGVWKAHDAVSIDYTYRASIMKLLLPRRVIFSLRRVRRVVRDDYLPCTIALFNVPYDLTEEQIQQVLEEDGGKKVLYVDFSTTSVYEIPHFTMGPKHGQDDGRVDMLTIREPVMVTFLHEADAIAAMTKWNRTKMTFRLSYNDENGQPITGSHRIHLRRAYRQTYRQETQEYLDRRLLTKLKTWDETGRDRYDRNWYEKEVKAIIPNHVMELEMEQYRYLLGYTDALPEYTVKNRPRPPTATSSAASQNSAVPPNTTTEIDRDNDDDNHNNKNKTSGSSSSETTKPIQYFKY
jgi:hypothetical protein